MAASAWVSNDTRAHVAAIDRPGRLSPDVDAVRAAEPMASALAGAERQLLDAAERLARRPQGWTALALHLSRLRPPAPRPHHRRVARALLQEAAQFHDGQVHALRNGDIVLLYRDHAPPGRAPADPDGSAPGALKATLARLLQADAPAQDTVISVWPLKSALDALLSYAFACLAEATTATAGEADAAARNGCEAAHGASIERSAITDLVQRQTGVMLLATRGSALAAMQPLYQELTLAIAALDRGVAADGTPEADPYLFRHLAARVDAHLLAALTREIGTGSLLDAASPGASAERPASALHVNLTVKGILSSGFAQFAAAAGRASASLGIEVELIEACADPAGFARAERIVRDAGMKLVLDSVSNQALLLARPATLRPDMMKLSWLPRLPEPKPDHRSVVTAALEELGPDRIVLYGVDSEAALRWGLDQGIGCFQGRQVEVMLGASRLMSCPHAAACTPEQCTEWAPAISPAGRSFCQTGKLLVAGVGGAMGPERGPRHE